MKYIRGSIYSIKEGPSREDLKNTFFSKEGQLVVFPMSSGEQLEVVLWKLTQLALARGDVLEMEKELWHFAATLIRVTEQSASVSVVPGRVMSGYYSTKDRTGCFSFD